MLSRRTREGASSSPLCSVWSWSTRWWCLVSEGKSCQKNHDLFMQSKTRIIHWFKKKNPYDTQPMLWFTMRLTDLLIGADADLSAAVVFIIWPVSRFFIFLGDFSSRSFFFFNVTSFLLKLDFSSSCVSRLKFFSSSFSFSWTRQEAQLSLTCVYSRDWMYHHPVKELS